MTKYALGAARPVEVKDWIVNLLSKEIFQLPEGCAVGDIVWLNNQYQALVAFSGDQVLPIQDAQLKQLKQKERERQQQLSKVQDRNSEPQRKREELLQHETREWHERQRRISAKRFEEKQRLEDEERQWREKAEIRRKYQEEVARERQEQQSQERKQREQERQDRIKQEQRLQPSAATNGGGCILTVFAVIISAVLLTKISILLLQLVALSLFR